MRIGRGLLQSDVYKTALVGKVAVNEPTRFD